MHFFAADICLSAKIGILLVCQRREAIFCVSGPNRRVLKQQSNFRITLYLFKDAKYCIKPLEKNFRF